MSEASRNLIRIITNLVRTAASMVIGLAFARLMLIAVGDDGLGLVLFLASTSGLGWAILEIVRFSMIRELGVAHHGGNRQQFIETFNAAGILCLIAAFAVFLLYMLLFIILHKFKIPPHLLVAARWLVLAKAIELVLNIIIAPQINMFMIKEQMVTYNLWMLIHRFTIAVPAVFLVYAVHLDQADSIKLFAVLSSGFTIIANLVFALVMMMKDHRTIPRPDKATRAGFKACLDIGKWNLAVTTAVNIHERVSQIFVNVWFGVVGNMIFGFALQLSSYIRMFVGTVTFGVDAVAARMSSKGADRHLQLLMSHSTRVHGFAAFPAFFCAWILAEPFITVWVGGQMDNPAANIPPTVLMIRIISIGIVARAVSDGWMRILYGAGHIRQYAPAILLGGMANPIMCCLFYYLIIPGIVKWLNIPDVDNFKWMMTSTAWPLMLIFLIVHMGILPVIGAPLMQMKKRELIWPLWRPLLVSLMCTPILWWQLYTIQNWNLFTLFTAAAIYGLVYAAFAWILVLNSEERHRIFQFLSSKIFNKSNTKSQTLDS